MLAITMFITLISTAPEVMPSYMPIIMYIVCGEWYLEARMFEICTHLHLYAEGPSPSELTKPGNQF